VGQGSCHYGTSGLRLVENFITGGSCSEFLLSVQSAGPGRSVLQQQPGLPLSKTPAVSSPWGGKRLRFQRWDPETLACSWVDDVAFYSLCGVFFSVMGRSTSDSSVEAEVVMAVSLVLALVMLPGSKKGYQACGCSLTHAA